MLSFGEFRSFVGQVLDEYYCFAKDEAPTMQSIRFPQFAIFTDFDDHVCVELTGSGELPNKLTSKVRRAKRVDSLFDPFCDQIDSSRNEGFFTLRNVQNLCISELCFAKLENVEAAEARFPIVRRFSTRFQNRKVDNLFSIDESCGKISFENCLFISQSATAVRARFLQFCSIFSKSKNNIEDVYNSFQNSLEKMEIAGAYFGGLSDIASWQAIQLQTLLFSDGIHETTIGDFLRRNPDFIHSFFSTEKFIYEPTLDWVEHGSSITDAAIRPDLLIQRTDGFFDIVDLKLAAIHRKKITKGERERRRFIDYVNEGISQLSNYELYFNFEANRNFAWRKYGIMVSSPNLYLLVGNQENFSPEEVSQALTPFRGLNLCVVDYDSVIHSLLSNPRR